MMIDRPSLLEIPLHTSPRVLAQGAFSIPLNGGQFSISASTLFTFSTKFTLKKECLYFFNSFSISANIPEYVFQGALVNPIILTLVLAGKGNSPFLRDGLQISRYFQSEPMNLVFFDKTGDNELKANLSGTIPVTPALAGKPAITLFPVVELIEVTDFGFIERFMVSYDRKQQGQIAKTNTVLTKGLTIRN